jgi:uncharacterized protein (DUF983 family)
METRPQPNRERTSAKKVGKFLRALRLRCPVCGQGRLFRGWFRMHEKCDHCGFQFERSPGYWLGSIFVNYGLTALLVTAAYIILFFTEALPETAILWLLVAFSVVFPLLFFRWARSFWLAIDLVFDPQIDDRAAGAADGPRSDLD